MPGEDNNIAIGKIGRSYGLRGDFHIWSYTRTETSLIDYLPLFFYDQKKECLQVNKARLIGKKIIGHCDAFNAPESIKNIVNSTLYTTKERLPTLPKGQHYWFDLVGLKVEDQTGTYLGIIDHIMDAPANPVIVITQENKKEKLLLPYIDQVVDSINLKQRAMKVIWHGYEEEDAD
jgi:16S rRNA processing protein RimM